MISKQLSDAMAAIALLTQSEQERLIAFLQTPPSIMSESPPVAAPKRASNRCVRWSDEDTQKVRDFLEDSTIMSDRSRRQAKRALCRELGRTEDGIKQKIFQLQNRDTQ